MAYDYAGAYAKAREMYPRPVFDTEDDGVRLARDFFFIGCPPGSLLETPDGRQWTVVYHNLDGYGVIEGDSPEYIAADDDHLPRPTHMLRFPYLTAELPCIGELIRVLRKAPKDKTTA